MGKDSSKKKKNIKIKSKTNYKNNSLKKSKKAKKIDVEIINIGICLFLLICFIVVIIIYNSYLNKETSKLLNNTEETIYNKKYELINNGFTKVNVESELNDYFKNTKKESVTYTFKKESFNLIINRSKTNKEVNYRITKILDTTKNVRARTNFENVKYIEYKTGKNDDTVLHIIGDNYSIYFIILDNTYYILGDDIESISYANNRFYYVSYNKKYKVLDDIGACNEDIKASIENFDENEIYSNYGKINFLKDYYQKFSSKKYTVGEKCNDMENSEESIKDIP